MSRHAATEMKVRAVYRTDGQLDRYSVIDGQNLTEVRPVVPWSEEVRVARHHRPEGVHPINNSDLPVGTVYLGHLGWCRITEQEPYSGGTKYRCGVPIYRSFNELRREERRKSLRQEGWPW
jgi:hypothetical protein